MREGWRQGKREEEKERRYPWECEREKMGRKREIKKIRKERREGEKRRNIGRKE